MQVVIAVWLARVTRALPVPAPGPRESSPSLLRPSLSYSTQLTPIHPHHTPHRLHLPLILLYSAYPPS
jgi:hypothetical protein